jgi:hypothetical protein
MVASLGMVSKVIDPKQYVDVKVVPGIPPHEDIPFVQDPSLSCGTVTVIE